ncbi:unnamed protein product [Pleuronectes platessa]|uniref:Uncharacterized protein n=1 Tax=Pleuronectes platessa TaxID=8262 RepID=A0A9N7UAG8_PLEPL|nr:unnamed protein product [Pleuronectes platessa]
MAVQEDQNKETLQWLEMRSHLLESLNNTKQALKEKKKGREITQSSLVGSGNATTFEVGKFGLESLRWGEIMPGSKVTGPIRLSGRALYDDGQMINVRFLARYACVKRKKIYSTPKRSLHALGSLRSAALQPPV